MNETETDPSHQPPRRRRRRLPTRASALGLVVWTFIATLTGGCRPKSPPPENLPAYQWVDEATALRDLRARADAIKTVSAECGIQLTKPDGESVHLDGALAMQNPGWVRLRAWKLNRAVFDLTLQPAGLWVMAMDEKKGQERALPASINAADFMRQWSYFNGKLFHEAGASDAEVRGDMLIVRRPQIKSGPRFHCEVDRRTLTPRRYVFDDPAFEFELTLDRYRDVNGVPWPTRLVAKSERGTVAIEQRDVEINGELAENAFVPPRRAEKRS